MPGNKRMERLQQLRQQYSDQYTAPYRSQDELGMRLDMLFGQVPSVIPGTLGDAMHQNQGFSFDSKGNMIPIQRPPPNPFLAYSGEAGSVFRGQFPGAEIPQPENPDLPGILDQVGILGDNRSPLQPLIDFITQSFFSEMNANAQRERNKQQRNLREEERVIGTISNLELP